MIKALAELHPGRTIHLNSSVRSISYEWQKHGDTNRYWLEVVEHPRGGYVCRVIRKPRFNLFKWLRGLLWKS